MPSERVSQEEQNGANFSSVAPSSEELWVQREILSKRLTIVQGFRLKSDFSDIAYHRKGLLKRSRMAQISAP